MRHSLGESKSKCIGSRVWDRTSRKILATCGAPTGSMASPSRWIVLFAKASFLASENQTSKVSVSASQETRPPGNHVRVAQHPRQCLNQHTKGPRRHLLRFRVMSYRHAYAHPAASFDVLSFQPAALQEARDKRSTAIDPSTQKSKR